MKTDNIPFPIKEETISYITELNTFKIDRVYKIPKSKLFESPNKQAACFSGFCDKEWEENGIRFTTFPYGWCDAGSTSYGLMIYCQPIKPEKQRF